MRQTPPLFFYERANMPKPSGEQQTRFGELYAQYRQGKVMNYAGEARKLLPQGSAFLKFSTQPFAVDFQDGKVTYTMRASGEGVAVLLKAG
jgi:hypothetical protein